MARIFKNIIDLGWKLLTISMILLILLFFIFDGYYLTKQSFDEINSLTRKIHRGVAKVGAKCYI